MSADRSALARDLRAAVEGDVRFDTQARALYATDASNFRAPPIGVVVPRTLDDVVAAHRVCHAHGAPIVNRGCGTSLSGETVNVAVVIDHSKHLTAIGDVDLETKTVLVEAGAVNQKVNEHTGRSGWIFGPDPSTHAYCTIGGNVGNNSCGTHSVQSQFYGPGPRTSDNVHSLEVVTYDGERFWVGAGEEPPSDRRDRIARALRELAARYEPLIRERYPSVETLPRRVSGYNLDDLLPERFDLAHALVGTESTCVTVLRARLRLTPRLPGRALVVVAFADICEAADTVTWILEHRPVGLEAIDRKLFADEQEQNLNPEALGQLPDAEHGGAWLLVELGAETRAEAVDLARSFADDARRHGVERHALSLFDDEREEQALWQVREAGLAATAFPPTGGSFWPGWEDAAVPPPRVGDYLRDVKRLYRKHGLDGAFYGHIGQGCMHSRIDFDFHTAEGLRTYRAFMEEAADLVVSYGGSLSGEHGDGQQRAELLPKQFGPELVEAFREFKRIWDPDWKMNPGKVVEPRPLDEDLRLGPGYPSWRPRRTAFAYRSDGGDFAHAALRCVGVGRCRKPDGDAVMCPSFVATRDEAHTTRGRARLLFEMLEGELVTDGWQSKEVLEALDLCLSCKGCTNDCPVGVDMPTYKAEFLRHHYGLVRPRSAYAFGLIDQAARVAARAPRLANALAGTRTAKRLAGMAEQRQPPRFARESLQAWARRRAPTAGPHVVLFPDTFTNRFHPQIGRAAVEVLERSGWQVVVPQGHLCCGRPLYDYGFLDLARRYLRRTLRQLRPWYRAGVPIVGLEPSCLAVLKDELGKLLPDDEDARLLGASARHFAEFVRDFELELPARSGPALLWGHCHQKATGGVDADRAVLEAIGLEVRLPAGGCCGQAGAWGFEAGHYEVSMAIAGHALVPALAEADGLVVANGFSCRSQISHVDPSQRPLHLAEVIAGRPR